MMTHLIPSAREPVHRPVLTPEQAARVERRRDEIELERLEAQLTALQADIDAARVAGRRAERPALGLVGLARKHAPALPPAHGDRVRLRDGEEILVRPVEPSDAPLVKKGFAQLGAVSRFRRFLVTVDRLDAQDLRFLTDVDHIRHEAYVAIDAATGDGVGIARYLRGKARSDADADAAIVVLDSWQHRGVGDVLADRLADAATINGVERFTGRMIVGNHAAERLLLRLGEPVERLHGPGTVQLTVRLQPRERRPAVAVESPSSSSSAAAQKPLHARLPRDQRTWTSCRRRRRRPLRPRRRPTHDRRLPA